MSYHTGRLTPADLQAMWHIANKFKPKAKKPFYPGANDLPVIYFQQILQKQQNKIRGAIQQLGPLAATTFLGNQPIKAWKKMANYLYQEAIHPRFLAETLAFLVQEKERLIELYTEVRLHNLKREKIAAALGKGQITPQDIGRDFRLFGGQPTERKLTILTALGVIVPNSSRAQRIQASLPPVEFRQEPNGQIGFF
jgi:hypothetical protein